MEKMKLPLEQLTVESFDAGHAMETRGTVDGRAISAGAQVCCTHRLSGCPDVTSIYTGQCCP